MTQSLPHLNAVREDDYLPVRRDIEKKLAQWVFSTISLFFRQIDNEVAPGVVARVSKIEMLEDPVTKGLRLRGMIDIKDEPQRFFRMDIKVCDKGEA
jgi:hypothetical protein